MHGSFVTNLALHTSHLVTPGHTCPPRELAVDKIRTLLADKVRARITN